MKEFLYKIGAWGKVRNTNKEGLTLAGLLMFSEERIITEVLPQYFLEYRETLSKTDEDWSKRLLHRMELGQEMYLTFTLKQVQI